MDAGKIVEGTKECMKVDITLDTTYSKCVTNGIEANKLAVKLLEKYPYLREVTLTLKEILAAEGLNVPYEGDCAE